MRGRAKLPHDECQHDTQHDHQTTHTMDGQAGTGPVGLPRCSERMRCAVSRTDGPVPVSPRHRIGSSCESSKGYNARNAARHGMAWHAHLQPPAHNRHVRSESGAAEHAQRRPPEVFAAALCVRHAPTSPSAHAGTGGIGGSTAPAASTQKRRPSADGRCAGARCMLSRLCAPGCDPICVRLAAIEYNTIQQSLAARRGACCTLHCAG